MAGMPLDIENLLPVQLLLLISLGLQVTLFLCAGVRRTDTSSGGLRVLLLWLAYNSADSLSTFIMARLWVISTKSNHPLVTLWAPFLLLHLAGPDNIAAYALQDNQLSLRSLPTFFSRVIVGAYFLYANRDGSGNFLLLASRLMFAVGVVKYGERWLALQRGNLGSIRDSVKKQPSNMHSHVHPQDVVFNRVEGFEILDEESHLRRAHSLDICKRAIVGSSEKHQYMEKKIPSVEYWTLVEMELSIMYDILYTKAAVIHTWHGYFIRVFSPLVILTSLLLFQFSGEDWQRGVDPAITYVLFGAALFMESFSLLNTLGSSWMYASLIATRFSWLRYKLLCTKRWYCLRKKVISLRRLVTYGGYRYQDRRWSGNMGQYNMLHFCTRPKTLLARPLLGSLANLVGLGELWNRKHFSGTINLSEHRLIKGYINRQVQLLYRMGWLNTLGMVNHRWGMATLSHRKLEEKFEEFLGNEFQEGIIIWHIATDLFLAEWMTANPDRDTELVNANKALSNYMMFLLVERPYMLPGIAQSKLYERTCKALKGVTQRNKLLSHRPRSICALLRSLFRWHDDPAGSNSRAADTKMLAENLYDTYKDQKFSYDTVRLTYSAKVSQNLLVYGKEHDPTESLRLLLQVWADMLVYASNKSSRESHAKKLSSGGELTTIVWLFVEHYHQYGLEQHSMKASAEKAPSQQEYHDNYRV